MSTIRRWSDMGYVSSYRTPGGQRIYDQDAVERVTLIKELFAAGLNSDGVVQLLPCIDSGTATSAMVERLICERARIDAEVSRLAATRDRLDRIIVQTRRHVLSPTAVGRP